MKNYRSVVLLLLVSGFAAPCFAHHMAVVISKQNAATTMTSVQLSKIFQSETKKWPDGKSITLILHRDSPGEAVTLQRLNKMSSQQWHAWIAEHQNSLKIVDSDDEVLTLVESVPGAVGLVDVRSVNGRVTIVRVDGKVPMEDGYLPH